MQAVGVAPVNRKSNSLAGALPIVEYGFYLVILYTVLGPPLGLILIGGIGSGFLMIPVLALSFVAIESSVFTVLQTAWVPIACGISYLFVQLALHEESIYGMYVYQFGPWVILLIIVQILAIHRRDFLHRFVWFTLFVGLAMLPFMSSDRGEGYERFGLERGVGFANPNALAGYFGFCSVYLLIKGYIETRLTYRLTAWLIAVASLFVVTLTVSRGALLAVAVSLLIASRRLLKVGFFPLLLLAGLLLGLTELGIFDQAVESYSRRAGEETGRLTVWPKLVEKFVGSPLIGVGASHAGAWIRADHYVTPHNGFLLVAVASGIIPLVLFVAYFFRSGMAAVRADATDRDSIFYLPLVVYAVLITCAGNMDFMTPWAVVSLAMPAACECLSNDARRNASVSPQFPAA